MYMTRSLALALALLALDYMIYLLKTVIYVRYICMYVSVYSVFFFLLCFFAQAFFYNTTYLFICFDLLPFHTRFIPNKRQYGKKTSLKITVIIAQAKLPAFFDLWLFTYICICIYARL